MGGVWRFLSLDFDSHGPRNRWGKGEGLVDLDTSHLVPSQGVKRSIGDEAEGWRKEMASWEADCRVGLQL